MTTLVIRRPVLMEDGGQYFIQLQFARRLDADEWLEAQKEEYFKPRDYFLVNVPQ